VLKEFGYLLDCTVTAEGATLARYGGDEFVVILPDLDLEEACAVASEIQTALECTKFLQGSFSWSEGPVYWGRPLTCSIGVAVYPHHLPRQGTTDMKKNLLLRAADLAMYEAKEQGKNQIQIAV
jgi:diguanylate cyclase (GGDEF)-like protein